MDFLQPISSALATYPELQQVVNNYANAFDRQRQQALGQYDRDMAAWANRMGIFGSENALTTMGEGRGNLQGQLESSLATNVLSLTPAVLQLIANQQEAEYARNFAAQQAAINREFQQAEMERNYNRQRELQNYAYQLQLEYADRLRQEQIRDYEAGVQAYRRMNPNWNVNPNAAALNQAITQSALNRGGGIGAGMDAFSQQVAQDPWWQANRAASEAQAQAANDAMWRQFAEHQGATGYSGSGGSGFLDYGGAAVSDFMNTRPVDAGYYGGEGALTDFGISPTTDLLYANP